MLLSAVAEGFGKFGHSFVSRITSPEWLGDQAAENVMQAIVFASIAAITLLVFKRVREHRQATNGAYNAKMVITICIFLAKPDGRWLLQLRTIGEVWINQEVAYPEDERMIAHATKYSIKHDKPILDLSPPAEARIVPTLVNLASTSDPEAISIFISRAATGQPVGDTAFFSTVIVRENDSLSGKLSQLLVAVDMLEGPLRNDPDIWNKIDVQDPRHLTRVETIRQMMVKDGKKALPRVELSRKHSKIAE